MNPLWVSLDLPTLDRSYEWSHVICGFLCLATFTDHNLLKVLLCLSELGLCSFLWLTNIPGNHSSLQLGLRAPLCTTCRPLS